MLSKWVGLLREGNFIVELSMLPMRLILFGVSLYSETESRLFTCWEIYEAL